MIRQISVTVLAAALFLPMPALAFDTVASRGDGYCPSERYSSDPDCARESEQQLSKSSRDEYPRCRNWRAGQPRPAGCRRSAAVASAESDKRNQFPDDRPRQPGHLG